jgi:nucleotide-binding universal stress UspA family protein
MIENILFPVDFSPASAGMAAYVKRVATLFQSQITLLHVCDLASHNGFELYMRTVQEIAEEHWSIGKQKLDSFLKYEFPVSDFKRVLCSGDPSEEIANFARSGGFDLIVMPTHGGRFRQMLLGSTTAKVLDDADCIVMTTEHADTAVPTPLDHRHWVCGIDFGPHTERLLRLTICAAEQAHAHVSFIHVDDVNDTKGNDSGLDAERRRILECFADQEIQIVKGPVKELLLEAVQRPLADALIIGRAPKHGLLGRMRDLAYGLIRDSPVPVLSV